MAQSIYYTSINRGLSLSFILVGLYAWFVIRAYWMSMNGAVELLAALSFAYIVMAFIIWVYQNRTSGPSVLPVYMHVQRN